jgi:hypothetical protein
MWLLVVRQALTGQLMNNLALQERQTERLAVGIRKQSTGPQ